MFVLISYSKCGFDGVFECASEVNLCFLIMYDNNYYVWLFVRVQNKNCSKANERVPAYW